jgi:hypothetical protein
MFGHGKTVDYSLTCLQMAISQTYAGLATACVRLLLITRHVQLLNLLCFMGRYCIAPCLGAHYGSLKYIPESKTTPLQSTPF